MNYDIQLSKHFKLSEFTKSTTATAKGIDNTPSLEIVSKLQTLCVNVLEPLREYFNNPITISSGYRCPALNKAVGGSQTSQHMTGEACDIGSASSPTAISRQKEWFTWIMDNCDFDQLIFEHNKQGIYWIHVSHKQDSSKNRHHVIQNLLKAS